MNVHSTVHGNIMYSWRALDILHTLVGGIALPGPLGEGELPHQCVMLALCMGVNDILPDDCRIPCRDGLTTRDK